MPAVAIIVAGVGALVVMVVVPALIFVTAFRSRSVSKLPTILALIVWFGVTVVLAGVWFIIAVAAHGVDDSLTKSWIVANASYPLIGMAIVLIYRRVLK